MRLSSTVSGNGTELCLRFDPFRKIACGAELPLLFSVLAFLLQHRVLDCRCGEESLRSNNVARTQVPTGYQMKNKINQELLCLPLYDLSSLFLFSLRLRRSTRFACILAASSAYLSFSSFAARLSLIAWTFLCN